MSDLSSASGRSSPRYNDTYKPQIKRTGKADTINVDDLKHDYTKALNYIETLKQEQVSLKNSLRLALCEGNQDNPKDLNSHRQSYHSTESFMSPRTMGRRLQDLEQENQELKALLETNSKRIGKLQNEQQDYLEKVRENETLKEEINELKVELNTLNREFCTITDKLLEVEVKNSDLLSQSIRYTQEFQTSEKAGVLKYANYIHQLISSADKNHFSFCCFEERFSKGAEFFNMIKNTDMSTLVLKAFKYITDLLININSQFYTSSMNSGSRIGRSSPEKSFRHHSQILSQEPSYISEDMPQRDFVQRVESPQSYDMSGFDDPPTPNIVARLMDRINQREKESGSAHKNTEIPRSPLKNSYRKDLSLELKDPTLLGKYNSVVTPSHSSVENSPTKRVQFKFNEDNKYGVQAEILEYSGPEDSRQTSRDNSKLDENSESLRDQDLVTRYKQELRERCKVIKETEKAGNKQKLQKEASYEQNGENSMNYSEQSKTHKEVSVLEMLSANSSATKMKGFIKHELDEKSSASGTNQRKLGPYHSRQNNSEASSIKTGEISESWHIKPKLRDYQINTDRPHKSALKNRDETTSLTREGSANKFIPVLSPRGVKSPKSSLTYQQISTARKSRAALEEERNSRSVKRKTNTSVSSDARRTDYVACSVAFGKNESKSKCSPSPSSRVMGFKDIPKKKRVDSYPKQTYDVIKGQELAKQRHIP